MKVFTVYTVELRPCLYLTEACENVLNKFDLDNMYLYTITVYLIPIDF